jgi:hypothetical protein
MLGAAVHIDRPTLLKLRFRCIDAMGPEATVGSSKNDMLSFVHDPV